VPTWLQVVVLVPPAALSLAVGWLVGRLLLGHRRAPRPAAARSPAPPPPSEEKIEQRLLEAESAGVDTSAAVVELSRLRERRAAGEVHIALFGEISAGKSSLVRALLPGAEAAVGVVGGTTRDLQEYRWSSPAGDRLVLTDMPGLSEVGRQLDALAREEALRAHVVIYLCEGDLTRDQARELEGLFGLGKPVILAVNKADRYSDSELQQVLSRLREHLATLGQAEVVAVSAGGEREVLRLLADGTEELVLRPIPPNVTALQQTLQRLIDSDPEALERLRDSAVFVLTARRLEEALGEQRRRRADALVDGYAKKAVVGAMAAMAPGTDLLIQGYLGTQMVRELSDLYQVPLRQADTDLLLKLVQKHVATSTTLLLAIAGNGLKAFPGAGTLAGGVLHAIAYGILFNALGRAVARSLESRGELHPVQAAIQFKETIGEDLENSARRFARMAFDEARRSVRND
jgi:uncharacterized protein